MEGNNSMSKKRKKYKLAVFMTRMITLAIIISIGTTVYKFWDNKGKYNYVESDAYVDVNGASSMIAGVQNGAVYQNAVIPILKIDNVKEVILTKDGEKVRFKSCKKIKKMGSYILSIEDANGNIDTLYFDIEY